MSFRVYDLSEFPRLSSRPQDQPGENEVQPLGKLCRVVLLSSYPNLAAGTYTYTADEVKADYDGIGMIAFLLRVGSVAISRKIALLEKTVQPYIQILYAYEINFTQIETFWNRG